MKKIILIFLLVIFFLIIRALTAQHSFMEQAKKTQNPIDAIRSYERALLFYVPFSPSNKKAIEGILERCESLTESEQKIYCYETLRSSLYQIKSFYQPYKQEINRLNPVIAELKAKEMINWKYNNFSERDYQTLYDYHMEILKYDGHPSTFWSIVSVFSLVFWITSVIIIIFKGLTVPINKKYLLAGVTGYIIFFSLWLLGLYMA